MNKISWILIFVLTFLGLAALGNGQLDKFVMSISITFVAFRQTRNKNV